MPEGPLLVACKHQSAWDTFGLLPLFDYPTFVMKRELFWIPVHGWFSMKFGMIGIDRSGAVKALKKLLADARKALGEGRQVIIFPEGTRREPGAEPDYKPGVDALYTGLGVTCLPVALNSGVFWPRRRFLRYPGTIVVEFLEPIPPGMRAEVTERAQSGAGFPPAGLDWTGVDLLIAGHDPRATVSAHDWLDLLAQQPRRPPLIVLADDVGTYEAVALMKAGASDFLYKSDVSARRLVDMARDVLSAARNAGTLSDSVADTSSSLGTTTQGTTAPETVETQPEIPGYQLREQIGEGATAKAFLATRERDGVVAVLKLINQSLMRDKAFLDRFLQEADIVTRIDSPHVVKIHEQAFSDSGGFIAMEYLSGGDLTRHIRRGISPARAVHYLRQIVAGLDAIHAVGIVHRDLKPANIMLRDDGSIAIVDFGISQRQERAGHLTDSGTVLGTPHYMSPEQARGMALDARSDIYSTGVVFYEMLTGKRPFNGDSAPAILYQHIRETPPPLPPKAAHCEWLIARLMAKEPEDRFESGAALIEALDAHEASES